MYACMHAWRHTIKGIGEARTLPGSKSGQALFGNVGITAPCIHPYASPLPGRVNNTQHAALHAITLWFAQAWRAWLDVHVKAGGLPAKFIRSGLPGAGIPTSAWPFCMGTGMCSHSTLHR